jgi:tetraacyldisaccharide 4'-kinase
VNPLSAIYAAWAWARNCLYDRGIFRSRRLARPVISVGNISVGGSGKTPFVILLGELLQQRGINFDVLSRGYGRKTRGALAVDPNGSAQEFGDEPILIAKRLGCPVVVGESRHEAGLMAETKFNSQIHILDDGFQHRSLARDFDIVLLAPEDFQDRLLPAGRLREPLSSLSRSDIVVMERRASRRSSMGDDTLASSRTDEMERPDLPAKNVWRVRRGIELSSAPARPVAFCGIAKPQKFLEQLRTAGVEIAAEKFYRDHHAYTSDDICDLLALRDQAHADGFVTTEKDAINLGPQVAQLAPTAVAKVHMELLDAADALDTILRVIKNRQSGREKIL